MATTASFTLPANPRSTVALATTTIEAAMEEEMEEAMETGEARANRKERRLVLVVAP